MFWKFGIHPFNANIFTDIDFAPSKNTSTIRHAPSSYLVYNPWFHKNGLGAHDKCDVYTDLQPNSTATGGHVATCGGISSDWASVHKSGSAGRDIGLGEVASGEGLQESNGTTADKQDEVGDEAQIRGACTGVERTDSEEGGNEMARENHGTTGAPTPVFQATLPRLPRVEAYALCVAVSRTVICCFLWRDDASHL